MFTQLLQPLAQSLIGSPSTLGAGGYVDVYRPENRVRMSRLNHTSKISRFEAFRSLKIVEKCTELFGLYTNNPGGRKFFSAEEVDLSFNPETKEHPQISNPSFWKRDRENVFLQMF